MILKNRNLNLISQILIIQTLLLVATTSSQLQTNLHLNHKKIYSLNENEDNTFIPNANIKGRNVKADEDNFKSCPIPKTHKSKYSTVEEQCGDPNLVQHHEEFQKNENWEEYFIDDGENKDFFDVDTSLPLRNLKLSGFSTEKENEDDDLKIEIEDDFVHIDGQYYKDEISVSYHKSKIDQEASEETYSDESDNDNTQDNYEQFLPRTESENNKISTSSSENENKVFNHREDHPAFLRTHFALDTNELQKLAISENILYKKLRKYYDDSDKEYAEANLTNVLNYLKDFESSSANHPDEKTSDIENANIIVGNPILMYRLINRLVQSFQKVKEDFQKDSIKHKGILAHLKTFKKLPDKQDVYDAIQGLLRMEHFYELDTDKFAQGEIGTFITNATLRAEDCLKIGLLAMEKFRISEAIEWLETSLRLASIKGFDQRKKAEITKNLVSFIIEHDREWDKMELEPNILMKYELFANKLSDRSNTRVKMSRIIRDRFGGTGSESTAEIENLDLCKGKDFQTPLQKSKLFCWLETKKHPYWRINPLKIELMHLDPDLIRIYDFIGNKLSNHIIEFSAHALRRSGIVGQNLEAQFTDDRTSINTWIFHNFSTSYFLYPLYKRIEFATGLNVIAEDASQALQVVDYSSLGSQYDMHPDALVTEALTRNTGDRIATFMLYLNEIKMGGSTGFPRMGTSAKPVKGSAVLWYNLLRNGKEDMRTLHSGCPTVLGRKLIANKWILSHENMFNRKCTLHKME